MHFFRLMKTFCTQKKFLVLVYWINAEHDKFWARTMTVSRFLFLAFIFKCAIIIQYHKKSIFYDFWVIYESFVKLSCDVWCVMCAAYPVWCWWRRPWEIVPKTSSRLTTDFLRRCECQSTGHRRQFVFCQYILAGRLLFPIDARTMWRT